MKSILAALILIFFSVAAIAQDNDFVELNRLIQSEKFSFLDSLARKSYHLSTENQMSERKYTQFVESNSMYLNTTAQEDLDRIFIISKDEFEVLISRQTNGYRNKECKNGVAEYLTSKITGYDNSDLKNQIYKYTPSHRRSKHTSMFSRVLYANFPSISGRVAYSFQFNNDLFLRKLSENTLLEDYYPVHGRWDAYGVYTIYKKENCIALYNDSDNYALVETNFALRKTFGSTADVMVTPFYFSREMFSETSKGIFESSEYGSVEFSFTRLWYWVENDKVKLQFDRSIASTPIDVAIRSGNTSALEILTNHGANIKYVDAREKTYLMKTVFSYHSELVPYLIKKGISIDAKDDMGNTALHQAVDRKANDETEQLLENGAKGKIKNNNGSTSYRMAYSSPRYLNNLLHMYRPLRLGVMLIDFGFAGDVFNANNSGTFSVELGPVLCQKINKHINIRHELNFVWAQIDLATQSGTNWIQLPDGSMVGGDAPSFTQLSYTPLLRYNTIPKNGVFMYYIGAGPGFSKTLSKEADFENLIKGSNIDMGIACGVEAYSNRFGFMMEIRYSRDLSSMIESISIKRNLFHLSMGFMF